MDIQKVQKLLEQYNLDYWVLTDYHGRDKLSKRLLNLPEAFFSSRRWVYMIPRRGKAIKVVSHIEKHILDSLEGETKCYSSYESLKAVFKECLSCKRVAMQYSKEGILPVIGTADAGSVELIQSIGAEVVSSGDLIQGMRCVLTEEQLASHIRAGEKIIKIRDEVYAAIRQGIEQGEPLLESDVLAFIQNAFKENKLTCDHDAPYVAVNDHATELTFAPTPDNSYKIQEGDRLLLDLWAREDVSGSIYYDVTFCAYVGEEIPETYKKQFEKVVGAREACLDYIQEQVNSGNLPKGYEVDQVCRAYFKTFNEADYFIHRTGHNIGMDVHDIGANLDSYEAVDDRQLMPGTLFSIEPGLYKDSIGVRTEVDVYLGLDKKLHIFGEKQYQIFKI